MTNKTKRGFFLWGLILLLQVLQGGRGGVLAESVPQQVVTLLRSPYREAQLAGLDWANRDKQAHTREVAQAILELYEKAKAEIQVPALRNCLWIYDELGEESALVALLKSAGSQNPELRGTALDVLKTSARSNTLLHRSELTIAFVARGLEGKDIDLRTAALDMVQASAFLRRDPRILSGLAALVHHSDALVRSRAVDLLLSARQDAISARIAVEQALARVTEVPDPDLQQKVAQALSQGGPETSVKITPVSAPQTSSLSSKTGIEGPLDFAYFAAFVQPLFTKRYPLTHSACVDCHRKGKEGVTFQLEVASEGRPLSEEQIKRNYQSALAQVNLSNPLESPLLRKPLNPRILDGPAGLPHSGGNVWFDANDPDYQIVRGWVLGEKLSTPVNQLLDFDYFVAMVQPIFLKTGPDGNSCTTCHSTHAILHLEPPLKEGRIVPGQLVRNYESALKVVDLAYPDQSLLLRKPISPREGAEGLSHAGGIRWPARRDSEEYRILLAWIQRKKLRE